jgi:hypothetical protein
MKSDFDLATLLERFPHACRARFGRTYNLNKLESKLEQVRGGKRWLVAKDVEALRDPEATPFALYWQWPDLKELDLKLRAAHLYLAPVEGDGRPLVLSLLGIFHNIGLASIVLRFVHPDRFGIFSTPVINLLQVHRAHTVDLYLAYCRELGEWRKHFRLATVADTEMALWTYQSLESWNSEEYARVTRAFEDDVWVQRRRAAQVLRPFLERYGPLELARILIDEDPKLAGKIAAEEYERLLRAASLRFFGRPLEAKKGAPLALIAQLAQSGRISLPDQAELDRVWEIRNKAIHPSDRASDRPTPEEIEVMIDRIQSICAAWELPEKPG